MADVSPFHTHPTEGLALAVFVSSITLGILTTLAVSIRIYVRRVEKILWWDDGMMIIGLLLFHVEIAVSCIAIHYGLAQRNTPSTDSTLSEALKYLMLFALFYAGALSLVKSSICVTMLRLTRTLTHIRLFIFALMALTFVSFLLMCIGTLPINGSDYIRMDVSYASTVLTIMTDMGCVLLPALIVWKTQLDLKTKLFVSVLLSFGSFASVCTMIRAPYIKYYVSEERLYWQGYVVLWSNIETAIGLIAGSLPVLQKLIVGLFRERGPHAVPLDIVTIGGTSRKSRNRKTFQNPTDTGFTVASVHAIRRSGDWERLDDSSLQGIRADYTYEVEMSQIRESESAGTKA